MSFLGCANSSQIFQQYHVSDIGELRDKVRDASTNLFGEKSIYLPFSDDNGLFGELDGILLEFTDPKRPLIFVVKVCSPRLNDISEVASELLKRAASYEADNNIIIENILKSLDYDELKNTAVECAVEQGNFACLDYFLKKAMYRGFQALVITDKASEELYKVLSMLSANVSVLEFKTFIDGSGEEYSLFDSIYDDFECSALLEYTSAPVKYDIKHRISKRAVSDTIVVNVSEEKFKEAFLGRNKWYPVKVGAAMKSKISHIAAYRGDSIKAITHMAEVKEIRFHNNSGDCEIIFDGEAWEIDYVKPDRAPKDAIYVRTLYGEDADGA